MQPSNSLAGRNGKAPVFRKHNLNSCWRVVKKSRRAAGNITERHGGLARVKELEARASGVFAAAEERGFLRNPIWRTGNSGGSGAILAPLKRTPLNIPRSLLYLAGFIYRKDGRSHSEADLELAYGGMEQYGRLGRQDRRPHLQLRGQRRHHDGHRGYAHLCVDAGTSVAWGNESITKLVASADEQPVAAAPLPVEDGAVAAPAPKDLHHHRAAVPPTPPLRKRLSAKGSAPAPISSKSTSLVPPPITTGPEIESVKWVNNIFSWLYSDLTIVNELVGTWILSLNEFTRKSVTEAFFKRKIRFGSVVLQSKLLSFIQGKEVAR
ncbi:hypothetical protein J437_LFUL011852 [Ladona fulva]|uniref:Uncharacterized protein n=1 Tax=Ladona fulva TaxID=123851 RepID=A0A8K0P6Z4_LADFU|nr:hypothetical protein J437_LFUL011852 [Ladona fulva]